MCITKEGGLNGGVQAADEAVESYWTDGDYFAARMENNRPSKNGKPSTVVLPYVLIDMRTDQWHRFATETELAAALPSKTAPKWSAPSPPYGCPCCSAVILAAFLPLTLSIQRRPARTLDPELY